MSNKDNIPSAADTAVSGYSPSPSPQPRLNGIDGGGADAVDDTAALAVVEMFPNINDANDLASSTDNEAPPAESGMDALAVNRNDDSPDDSLNEMVQSILNDSDNEVILNNINMMGYNNTPSQWNDNENTATNAYSQPTAPRSKPQVW